MLDKKYIEPYSVLILDAKPMGLRCKAEEFSSKKGVHYVDFYMEDLIDYINPKDLVKIKQDYLIEVDGEFLTEEESKGLVHVETYESDEYEHSDNVRIYKQLGKQLAQAH